jgi:hypothetical protein
VVTAAIVVPTPSKNLNKVFWGLLVVSPLFYNFHGCLYTTAFPSFMDCLDVFSLYLLCGPWEGWVVFPRG